MKKFTIISSAAIVLVFIATMIAVALMPDFVKPTLAGEGEDPDAPVWKMTMDDLFDYLDGKGLIDKNDTSTLTEGIANIAISSNGAEFYWWDLENLSEDSDEMAAYKGMMEDGQIDLWGKGVYFMAVTKNGPFGMNASNYEGSVKDLLAAFEEFGK